jgi:hypothetical protein
MIPFGSEIKVIATHARIGHRLGDEVVIAEIGVYGASDFSLVLTNEQARSLADQLVHPSGRMGQAFRAPVRWLALAMRGRS